MTGLRLIVRICSIMETGAGFSSRYFSKYHGVLNYLLNSAIWLTLIVFLTNSFTHKVTTIKPSCGGFASSQTEFGAMLSQQIASPKHHKSNKTGILFFESMVPPRFQK